MRRVVFLATVVTTIALTPAWAAANGGATLDFGEEQPYLLPEGQVQGTAVVWMGKKDVRALQDGPYHAYLLPEEKWIKPPRIPDGAIRVGTLDFSWINERKAVATVSFVVPPLPSDRYSLHYCNDPCTEASIGDLYGTSVLIAQDAETGALLLENERFQARAASSKWRLQKARRQLEKLEQAADGQASEIEPADPQAVRVNAAPTGSAGDVIAWVGAAGAGMAAGFFVGRRRRRPTPYRSPVRQAERILERVR